MSSLSFARLWQQQEYSDLDVVLWTADQDAPKDYNHLAKFPGHSVLLSNSHVLQAHILCWEDGDAPKKEKITNTNPDITSTDGGDRPKLVLALQDESEQTAAMTVLSSLYAVKPLHELLAGLTQEQQLQAALLAEKWSVQSISTAAAQQLVDALSSESGLSKAVKQRIMTGPALPDCLQPLMKSVLLSELGDLDAAWADAGLREKLLGLSLPAMELLLSCDEVKVASEDNVLCTANKYVNTFSCPAEKSAAKQRLAPLVRCQHLSQFWLSTSVASNQAVSMVLSSLRPQLSQLLLLRCCKPGSQFEPSEIAKLVPKAPASWALGQRASNPAGGTSSVSVTWNVSVSAPRQAAQRSLVVKRANVSTPVHTTVPLGGLTFYVYVCCEEADGGCQVGVYANSKDVPADAYYSFKLELTAAGVRHSETTPAIVGSTSWGWKDFFSLGAMAGGWDEAAWAAKGLPASGELPITLTVSQVAHSVLS